MKKIILLIVGMLIIVQSISQNPNFLPLSDKKIVTINNISKIDGKVICIYQNKSQNPLKIKQNAYKEHLIKIYDNDKLIKSDTLNIKGKLAISFQERNNIIYVYSKTENFEENTTDLYLQKFDFRKSTESIDLKKITFETIISVFNFKDSKKSYPKVLSAGDRRFEYYDNNVLTLTYYKGTYIRFYPIKNEVKVVNIIDYDKKQITYELILLDSEFKQKNKITTTYHKRNEYDFMNNVDFDHKGNVVYFNTLGYDSKGKYEIVHIDGKGELTKHYIERDIQFESYKAILKNDIFYISGIYKKQSENKKDVKPEGCFTYTFNLLNKEIHTKKTSSLLMLKKGTSIGQFKARNLIIDDEGSIFFQFDIFYGGEKKIGGEDRGFLMYGDTYYIKLNSSLKTLYEKKIDRSYTSIYVNYLSYTPRLIGLGKNYLLYFSNKSVFYTYEINKETGEFVKIIDFDSKENYQRDFYAGDILFNKGNKLIIPTTNYKKTEIVEIQF